MEFVLAVQRNKVIGPLRRGFDQKIWDAEHARLGTDERDAHLHAAGIRIHEKAATARAFLGFAASDDVEVTEESRHLLLLRAYANEPYYADLLNEAQPALNGACIHDLFNVWAFVRSVALVLRGPIRIDGIPPDRPEHDWLPTFTPVVKLDVLIRSASAATAIEPPRTSAIVEFLTYKGGSPTY